MKKYDIDNDNFFEVKVLSIYLIIAIYIAIILLFIL